MKFGVQINRFDYPGGSAEIGETLATIAGAADTAGFDSIWVMDHFFQLPMLGPDNDPMLEAYTTLGYLAGVTKKAKLGALVTGVIYREPALLIKAVTALDVVSGGRAYFGIGAGWYEEESIAMGFMNPLHSRRFERLEEALKLAKQMFADDQSPFKGEHYKLEKPMDHPLPVQKPHPPIMIGGGGEQKTLRLVAEYGDACNLFGNLGEDAVKHKLEVIKRHCLEVGRNYDDIEKTVMFGYEVDPASSLDRSEEIIEQAKRYAEMGVSHVIFRIGATRTAEPFERFAGKLGDDLHQI